MGGKRWSASEVVLILVILAILVAVLWPVHAGGGPNPNAHCLSNLKQHALATLIYLGDHDDRLPPSEKWFDVTAVYRKNDDLVCPELKGGVGYAMNEGHAKLPKRPEVWVMLFETAATEKNAHGNLGMLLEEPRHGGVTVAFGDGSAVALRPDEQTTVKERLAEKLRLRRNPGP